MDELTRKVYENQQAQRDFIQKSLSGDLEKAKYIRREGSKGNYKYIYDEPKDGQSKKEINMIMTEDYYQKLGKEDLQSHLDFLNNMKDQFNKKETVGMYNKYNNKAKYVESLLNKQPKKKEEGKNGNKGSKGSLPNGIPEGSKKVNEKQLREIHSTQEWGKNTSFSVFKNRSDSFFISKDGETLYWVYKNGSIGSNRIWKEDNPQESETEEEKIKNFKDQYKKLTDEYIEISKKLTQYQPKDEDKLESRLKELRVKIEDFNKKGSGILQ